MAEHKYMNHGIKFSLPTVFILCLLLYLLKLSVIPSMPLWVVFLPAMFWGFLVLMFSTCVIGFVVFCLGMALITTFLDKK